ncbi:LPP20 family lipoprotein [Helicobacter sp. faydin-H20]|uniref:LPP20 family lipoprotein n=1 Tax=Helicobacter anatolicus TaxID=2905874 RepID=UPI001E3AC291|nr:LPP20 family lipoprotein [Helicobacter anatolicus]MCE3036383.1 LPP20 family lipoprotein [Helicobacter anatolicus]
MKRILFFLGVCVFLGAEPPKWFSNTQDSMLLIGNGSAKNMTEAKSHAISDLASLINVNINSSLSINTQRKDEKISTHAQNQVFLDISDIELLGVKVLQQEFSDGIYYVQVGLNKQTFLTQVQKNIHTDLERARALHPEICTIITPDIFANLKTLVDKIYKNIGIYETFSHTRYVQKDLDKFMEILQKNGPMPKINIKINGGEILARNALQKEIAKFSIIDEKLIENYPFWQIIFQKNGDSEVVDLILKDCKKNIVYQDQIILEQKNLHRVGFVFYKKFKKWLDSFGEK